MKSGGIGSLGVVIVASSTFAQLCAGWMAVLPIAALALYGWFHGLFLAVVAGLQMLTSFVVALACAPVVAGILASFGMTAEQALAVAYVLVFIACVVIIRLAVGAGVPEDVVRFKSLVDGVGGACAGAVAGAILGGALLVGWSLAPVPNWMRFDATQLPVDSGRRMLWTFARFATPSVPAASHLFTGDAARPSRESDAVIRASEPFVDANGNGIHDGGGDGPAGTAAPERYLDLDGNGSFTPTISCVDFDSDGRRAIGMQDCYRLGEWCRVRCMHGPILTSVDTAEIHEDHEIEEPIYRATATDVDGNETLTYRVLPAPGDEAVDVQIEAATGTVTLLKGADFETKKRHDFVVEVRDGAGLTDTKKVSIRVRDVPLQ